MRRDAACDRPTDPLDDPAAVSLREWLRSRHGTRTGTFTFNDVTYTDLNEVEWRLANNEWLLP